VPFSLRTAEHYMLVAKRLGPFSQHVANLPSTLRTLLVLCQLQHPALQTAIEEHRVHPGMREKEAKKLLSTLPSPKVEWSIESYIQDLHKLGNKHIDTAPPGSLRSITDQTRRYWEKLEEAARSELREAVAIARDELSIRDAEPGGFRIFENDIVIAPCKSTYPQWYKDLTTAQPGVTALRRKQVEARLADIESGKLPTPRTARTYTAVAWAIQDLAQISPLGRGRW